ncbi:MAG: M24 family metallopeptidase [Halobacteriota archaeon]
MEDRYESFPPAEYDRRHERVRQLMDDHDLDALLVHGDSVRGHHNVHYLSNYRGHGLSYLVWFADPAEEPTLFFGISNHLQYARDLSVVADVRWGEYPMTGNVVDRVESADGPDSRIGLVGVASRHDNLVPHGHYETFDARLRGELVDVTAAFERLRYVKSDEEIAWIRRGAELTDRGLEALVEAVEPGVTEHDLEAAFLSASARGGGDGYTTFISSSPMDNPDPGECLPWKEPAGRIVRSGDVVTTELSAAYGGYMGQIHRPIAVGTPPTDTYQDLFDVALETYENMVAALAPGNTARDVAEAVRPIEESEYKIYDVNLHGVGMTLQPPFIGTTGPHSNYWPAHESPSTAGWTFEENQVIVVQPNVVTPDERYGLQLGTTVVVGSNGPEVIQDYPVEFIRA